MLAFIFFLNVLFDHYSIKARFLELGYVERDIDMEHLRSHREGNSATQLTDRSKWLLLSCLLHTKPFTALCHSLEPHSTNPRASHPTEEKRQTCARTTISLPGMPFW